MNSKLLIICGPTATGKTDLGLKLAQEFNGEIVSADSRQVYAGMDIGTGKDVPSNFEFRISNFEFNQKPIPFYTDGVVKLWGYDLAQPNQDFSISQYVRICSQILQDIKQRNKLPIIVGGTGHYIRSLILPPETITIPQDLDLRQNLEKLSVFELQLKLQNLDPEKWDRMNHSDQRNSRRLVRALEVVLHQQSNDSNHRTEKDNRAVSGQSFTEPSTHESPKWNQLWLGLQLEKEELHQRIEHRVQQRIKQGMVEEVKQLQLHQLDAHLPAASAIGYQQIQAYVQNKISLDEAIAQWVTAEKQYVKRQLTWFNRNQRITWFDPTHAKTHPAIVAIVRDWYSKNHD